MSVINLAYLELRLSGGAANADPLAALGGAQSSHRILSKSGTGITNITGVTVDDAPGSTDGAGTLAFTATGQTLTWTPAGGTAGTPVAVGADGRYAIPGANADTSTGYLFVTVTAASLPAANQSDTITVAALANELFDDISKVESFNGDTEYRCFYVHNAHPTDPFIGAKIYIGSQPAGGDTIAIGLDPAGLGDGSATGVATTVADENTAPAGVTFSAPTTSGTGLAIGQIDAGVSAAVWERRVVPSGTTTSTPNDISSLALYVGY